jgi:3-dehydroquinate synthase
MTAFYFNNDAATFNASIDNKPIIIIADANSNGFCLPKAKQLIPALSYAYTIVIPAGEENKNLDIATFIIDNFMAIGVNKTYTIINIGGGVVCDIGAYVASTYMRGFAFINIPTTLLAMNDASFGGKNGINYNGVKNNIGTITHPTSVFISNIFLHTLSNKQIISGAAEILKHALIDTKLNWDQLITSTELSIFSSHNVLQQSIDTKMKLVLLDENDNNQRRALNFGHTIGHAVESASYKYGSQKLLHGQAILLGMLAELYLSEQFFGLSPTYRTFLKQWITEHCPYILQTGITANHLTYYLQFDKKNKLHTIQASLLKQIGNVAINTPITTQAINTAWQAIFA